MNTNLLSIIYLNLDFLRDFFEGFEENILEVALYLVNIGYVVLYAVTVLLHELALSFLLYTPTPGTNEGEGTVEYYIFSAPPEENSFHILHLVINDIIEPLALFLVLFAIVVTLFLSIFDIVIEDIGLNSSEAKKRLFVAPLLIILWIPLANLVLYFAFTMTDFIQGITIIGEAFEVETDIGGLSGGEINIGSYFDAMVPSDMAQLAASLQIQAIIIGLAVITSFISALIYLLGFLLAIMRVVLLFVFYVLGPIAIVLWAFNWKELAKLGGTTISWFVLLSLIPVVAAFMELILPVIFVIMTEFINHTVFNALETSLPFSNILIFESINASELVAEFYASFITQGAQSILAIVFLLLTPIFITIFPWGIVIGFKKAMAAGVAAGGLAAGGVALGAGGALLGASKGASGISSAYSAAYDSAKEGVSGDAMGTAAGMTASSISRRKVMAGTAKNLGKGFKNRMGENAKAVKYGLKQKYKNTSWRDAEKSIVDSKVLDKRLGTFGDTVQTGLKTDLTAKDKISDLQLLKDDEEMSHEQGYSSREAADIPLDENGYLDESRATDEDRVKMMARESEINAMADNLDSDQARLEMAQEIFDGNYEENMEKITDEELANKYVNTMMSEDKNVEDIWSTSTIEDINQALSDVDKKQLRYQIEFDNPEKSKELKEDIDSFMENTIDDDMLLIENDLKHALYNEEDIYQDNIKEETDRLFNDQFKNNNSIEIKSEDSTISTTEANELLLEEFVKNGGDKRGLEKALSHPDLDESIVDTEEEINQLFNNLQNSLESVSTSLESQDFEIDLDNPIESIVDEYEKVFKNTSISASEFDSDMPTQFNFFQEFMTEVSNLGLDDIGQFDAQVQGTFVEEAITEALETHEEHIRQNTNIDIDAEDMGALDLETRIDLMEFVNEDELQKTIDKKLKHLSELGGNEMLSSKEIANQTEMIAEAVNERAKESVEKFTKEKSKDFENQLSDLSDVKSERVMNEFSDDTSEFLNTIQEKEVEMFEELESISEERRQQIVAEIDSINVHEIQPTIDFKQMGLTKEDIKNDYESVVNNLTEKFNMSKEEVESEIEEDFEWVDFEDDE